MQSFNFKTICNEYLNEVTAKELIFKICENLVDLECSNVIITLLFYMRSLRYLQHLLYRSTVAQARIFLFPNFGCQFLDTFSKISLLHTPHKPFAIIYCAFGDYQFFLPTLLNFLIKLVCLLIGRKYGIANILLTYVTNTLWYVCQCQCQPKQVWKKH